ncbi:hypothetical protein D0812_29325 (plasmid) [Vibrio owensii]|uniref:Uncharacterized protein n=1 Tax=Vibrio owensii TaxID=696485 RepID=A0ABM6ZS30_9VIBR|nr:hypothetical protein [Vibrio owensii]AYO18526.1 hypothetical protein D0812_29325 [Vibrio owensii]MDF4776800.1 hypothetical protein [Vibrio parahaemolyticus]
MEFRYPVAVAEANASSRIYLTKELAHREEGEAEFELLLSKLGNAVNGYPDWHPILTIPNRKYLHGETLQTLYKGLDHTRMFVRGFVTCPYDESEADALVETSNMLPGINSYRLKVSLYSDYSYPVVVEATDVELEADGTIRSRDALAWYVQEIVKNAHSAQVAETWWNLRGSILGQPHGSRSSLFVNQYTGGHMRKILDALNNSGMYGPIKEWSLEMLSKKKRDQISETLIRTAIQNSKNNSQKFEFELHGETCKATIRDTWDDGSELSIRVQIGDMDDLNLLVNGFYYPKKNILQVLDPNGKRAIAEKFL